MVYKLTKKMEGLEGVVGFPHRDIDDAEYRQLETEAAERHVGLMEDEAERRKAIEAFRRSFRQQGYYEHEDDKPSEKKVGD